MAQSRFINTQGGDFALGTNWSAGVPGPTTDALLTTTGNYTVTSATNETVHSLQMVQNVTLAITGGTFQMTAGSGTGTDNGVINIGSGASLAAGGTIAGTGLITLNGYYQSSLILTTGTTTLSGGGQVQMTDTGANVIYAATAGNTLVNVNDTISGSGSLGLAQTAIVNQAGGIINATGAGTQLVIDSGAYAFTNAGLLEATGAAGLNILNSTVTNTGTIKAAGAAINVFVQNTTVNGGKLASTAGGAIQISGTSVLNGVSITAGSNVVIGSGQTLDLSATLTNAGTLQMNGYYQSTLALNTPVVTLTGSGTLLLSDTAANVIAAGAAGAKLVNANNTIIGSGQIGLDQMAFTNQAAGIVNAAGAGTALVLDFGAYAAINAGLLEATNTGGLVIQNTTLANTGGTIKAAAAGANVSLNAAAITGGTLSSVTGSAVYSNTSSLSGVTLSAASNLVVSSGQSLTLNNSLTNLGTLSMNGYYQSDLIANTATTTLTGGGTIALNDTLANRIYGAVATNTLVNVDNTIVGSAQLGAGQGTFDNQALGVIDSTGGSGISIVATGFSNEGLIEDTGTGGVSINSTTITNSGTIAAFGTMTHVDLSNGTIVGGTLRTTGGGVIQTVASGVLDGSAASVTLLAGSTLQINSGTALTLDGTLVNHGTIAINGYYQADLVANTTTTTMTGGGTIQFNDSLNNRLYGALATDAFVNVNNTLTGSAQIGSGQGTIDNQAAGIINSSATSGMILNATAFTNEGLIEATNTGGISIASTTIVNTGTIAANGAGNNVQFNSGGIKGGTLGGSGGGVFYSVNQATLDGSGGTPLTIASSAIVQVNSGTTMNLLGSIVNKGLISFGGYYNADLVVASPTVTLSSTGTIALSDTNANRIYGLVAADKLVNVGNTIIGAGQFGAGQLTLDNQKAGLIEATGATALSIVLNSSFTNEGTAEGAGSGGLLIQNTTLTNTGTIAALSDSTATIDSSSVITNVAAGTLTGGTWEAMAASGHAATLTIAAGPITVDAARLVLAGPGATILAGGVSVVSSIKTITSKGELDVQNGATYAAPATLTNGGKILLSGTLSAPAISNTATGSITANGGAGVISTTGKLANAGLLQATAGSTLQLAKGTVTNTGSILAQTGGHVILAGIEKNTNLVAGVLTGGTWGAIGNNATLSVQDGTITTDAAIITLSGAGSLITSEKTGVALEATLGTIAAGGILNVLNGRGFASGIAGGLADQGTIALGGGTLAGGLTIASGALFEGTGTIAGAATDNGLLLSTTAPAGSTGTLTLAAALTGTGTLQAASATTLATAGYTIGAITIDAGGTLTGAGSVSGALADAGTLVLAGGTLAAGSVTIAAGALLSGFGTVAQTVADSGTIAATGGTLAVAGASGTGSATLATGATLQSSAALTVAGVTFAGTTETLALGTPAGNTALIAGFAATDTIDLLNAVATSFTYNPTTGVLGLKNGTTGLGQLKFAGSYTKTSFALASDGHGGTDILFVPSAVADLHAAIAATAATPPGSAAAAPPTAAALSTPSSPGAVLHTDIATSMTEGLMTHLPAIQ